MTITTTQAAMQTLNRSITGVKTAPAEYPSGELPTAHLPMAITWPSDSATSNAAMGFNVSQRYYSVNVYVMPVQQGRGTDEGWALAMTLLQRFVDAYLDSDNILLVTGTYQASVRTGTDQPISDNGIEVLAYPPPATGIEGWPHYFGFQLRVLVKETWSQT
jgi:hypothetical protein